MKTHPAQPDNLRTREALKLLHRASCACTTAASELSLQMPTGQAKQALSQVLAGAIADIEVVKAAINL